MGLGFGLLFGMIAGFTATAQIVTRTVPNEGIRRSLKNALISLTFGTLGGPVMLVTAELVTAELDLWNIVGSGLGFGLLIGMIAGLKNGGFAYLKHYVLRVLLWRNDYAPWNYIRFLDYAAERVFLRKVGGGYVFTHRLLMEYFATLQSPDQAVRFP